jgi:PmbA protein
MVGEKPAPSGRYACVIENRVVGRLLYNLIDPLAGRNIQQQRSFLADKLGQPVGSEHLNVVDDPHVIEGLGSTAFDGEGMSTARLALFDRGVLENHLLDTYYASKLGRAATFGSTTNLIVAPGERDLAGLLAAMGDGILITGFSGGNSNSATGDFSVGVRGLRVEKGRISRPVAEMNLSGNHLKFWNMLAEAGSDVQIYSSIRSPSLRFDPVQFSGA